MPRGLFGRNDLMAAHSKSASSYRMIRGSVLDNHVQTDAFNRQNRTIGASEITSNRTCQRHAKTDAIDPKEKSAAGPLPRYEAIFVDHHPIGI
jgi:hypothetical protein